MRKTLSVIIPTLNEEEYIRQVLDDVLQQSHKPDEILVIDCGSTDATRSIVTSYTDVQCIVAQKPVGNQRHVGAQTAKGDTLVFLDADTQLDAQFFEKSLAYMGKTCAQCACPRYVPYPGSFSIRLFYGFFNVLFWVSQKKKASGAGSCIFIEKELYKRTHGFDKHLTYDDIALIREAGEKGTFCILPTAIRVSDRRIRRDGLVRTLWTYMKLSIYFAQGSFQKANKVPYIFGHYRSSDA